MPSLTHPHPTTAAWPLGPTTEPPSGNPAYGPVYSEKTEQEIRILEVNIPVKLTQLWTLQGSIRLLCNKIALATPTWITSVSSTQYLSHCIFVILRKVFCSKLHKTFSKKLKGLNAIDYLYSCCGACRELPCIRT